MTLYTVIVAIRPSTLPQAALPGYEFLMVANRRRGHTWELPGGRGLDDEPAQTCAEREFLEETGRRLLAPRLIQRRTDGDRAGYVFLGDASDPVARPIDEEISDTRFFDRLPERAGLSFPDDPYEELFAAARQHLAGAARTPAHAPRGP